MDLRQKFETDGAFQTAFHLKMTYFWMVNFVAANLCFIFTKGIWNKFSIIYLVDASLYANFATDYGAVSAAEANEQTDHD